MLATVKDQQADVRRLLVVDDQADVREALRLLLKGAGYAADTAESPSDALRAACSSEYDLIVIDMNYTWDTTSGEEGLRLLDRLRAHSRDVPVIAMTGWSTIELAVEAMHRGARDFVPKPWENRHLLSVINKHLTASREQREGLDAELAIARKVQRKLLPQPHFPAYGLECECASLPAGEISGDLYDFFEIDDKRMAFLVGDVCGKGIGAALLVANLQATIRSHRDIAHDPSRLMDRVNHLFFESTRPEHFATLFFGVYDAASGDVRFINCGHPPPVLLRDRGGFELLEPTATVLGAFQGRGFEAQTATLRNRDRLVLFSDGFSEAKLDQESESWAVDTICRLGRRQEKGLATALASAATASGKPTDDVTVVDIRLV